MDLENLIGDDASSRRSSTVDINDEKTEAGDEKTEAESEASGSV